MDLTTDDQLYLGYVTTSTVADQTQLIMAGEYRVLAYLLACLLPSFLPSFLPCLIACLLAGLLACSLVS